MRNKLFGSREFYHRVLAISAPIMIQNVLLNVKPPVFKPPFCAMSHV